MYILIILHHIYNYLPINVLKCDQVQSYITHVYNTLVKISEAVYRAGLPTFFHICSNHNSQF